MRVLNWIVIVVFTVSIFLLASMSYNQKSNGGGNTRPGAAVILCATSAPPLVSLPNYTELVKREGPAVVNISTTQKISVENLIVTEFPGMDSRDPFFEFFRRFAPADQMQRKCGNEILKPSSSLNWLPARQQNQKFSLAI